MQTVIKQIWYKNTPISWVLVPFAWIYQGVCSLRRVYLTRCRQRTFTVPVIVVGNITLGGVGKTPLVIELAKKFSEKGLKVGIVSRGYGARTRIFPHAVKPTSQSDEVGDEPLLIARRTACPVIIDPNRVAAIDYLLKNYPCDVVISDDGLQHYAMGRSLEIVVVDGARGFGNGRCLPAGPLREPINRIKQSDFVVINGAEKRQNIDSGSVRQYSMTLVPGPLVSLMDGKQYPIDFFTVPIAAVAAIGNPQRFFLTLKNLGCKIHEYPFSDHYFFKPEDFNFSEEVIVMTEKDAVKCKQFARKNWFYLPVEVKLSEDFWQAIFSNLQLKRLVPV